MPEATAASTKLARSADLRSQVNEKLLTALVALLAIKDEHLLEELTIIFDHAHRHGFDAEPTSAEVWRALNRRMKSLSRVVDETGDDHGEGDGDGGLAH